MEATLKRVLLWVPHGEGGRRNTPTARGLQRWPRRRWRQHPPPTHAVKAPTPPVQLTRQVAAARNVTFCAIVRRRGEGGCPRWGQERGRNPRHEIRSSRDDGGAREPSTCRRAGPSSRWRRSGRRPPTGSAAFNGGPLFVWDAQRRRVRGVRVGAKKKWTAVLVWVPAQLLAVGHSLRAEGRICGGERACGQGGGWM